MPNKITKKYVLKQALYKQAMTVAYKKAQEDLGLAITGDKVTEKNLKGTLTPKKPEKFERLKTVRETVLAALKSNGLSLDNDSNAK